MGKQPTTFRITGTESVVTRLDVESFFDKVNKHVGLKYAFAGIGLGSNAFLLNLKNKATLTFVEKALERALGSQYSAESVATSTGQKFVPGERRNEGRCKATIELEAAAATAASHHEDSPAKIFVLVGVSQRATYSYTQAGLVKVGKNEDRPARPLENGNPMPAGEEAGVASGLVAPHHQLLPLSHKLPAEFSSDAHGRALNGQARGGGGGGGGEGGGGGGEGNNGACKPIDDRPDESLPLQSFPGGGGGGGGKLHEHSGVNGMSAEDGGWEGELPHWHIEFEYLPDGSIGDGDEGKHARQLPPSLTTWHRMHTCVLPLSHVVESGVSSTPHMPRSALGAAIICGRCPPGAARVLATGEGVFIGEDLRPRLEASPNPIPYINALTLYACLSPASEGGTSSPTASHAFAHTPLVSNTYRDESCGLYSWIVAQQAVVPCTSSVSPRSNSGHPHDVQRYNLVQERPENRQERRLQIPVGSPPSIVPSIDSTTSYHDFYKRGGSTSSFGPESERLLKVAVHEALELERWSLLCDTASTPLQSVPDLASVMNSSWDKVRAERDGKESRQTQKTTAGGEFSAWTYFFSSPHADGCAFLSFADQGGRIFVETERLSPRVHLDPIAAVRRILPTGRDPSIHVPKLVDFVQNEDDPALQLQAGRLLATISGTHAKVVVQNGAVPVFVRLLTSANDDVREEVVRAVGNIAGDSPLSRDLVLQRDALGPLLQQLTDRSKLSMLRIATWALSKFCGEISPARLKQVGPALPTLARLTHSIDEEVLRNACAALRYLCTPGLTDFGAHREMVQAVVGTGVCQRLVELLDHASPAVHLEVLWAMDGIVSSEIQHAQELIYSNVLPRLHHQLISSHQKLRWKACQVICRITSGREEQIQAVIEAGVIPTVIQFLADVNSNIRRVLWFFCALISLNNCTAGRRLKQEISVHFVKATPVLVLQCANAYLLLVVVASHPQFAASAISNAAEVGEPEEVKGWIPALLSLLKNDDTQVIPTVIEILEKLLKVVPDFDAWRRLRHLLSSSNTTVREKTCQVIDCITRGNKEQSRAMIDAGIVPALIEHLDDAKCGIRSYAASAISNATEVGELEEVKGWIPALLSLLENDDARVVPTVIEILEKLLKMVPDSDAWRRLRHLLSSSDTIVLEKTCQVINCITRGNKEQSRAMIDAGIVPALIEHLDDAECGIRSYAASAISNATEVGELEEVKGWIPALLSLSGKYGDTEAITTVIEVLEKLLKMVPDSDAWRWLRHLLSSSDTVVRERTCQVIDCITRGNKEQPRAMIDAGIVPALIEHLDDAKCGIRSFVASAILNATKLGAPEEVRAWIPLLLSRWERFDIVAVVVNALEILEKILERGDTDAKAQGQEMNQMAACMTECGGWKHLQRLERFGFSESVGRISFCDIGPKVWRNLKRRFLYAKYLMLVHHSQGRST
ncbi:unnamed protein product [Ectocarpus sp. 4 AP-2014]